MDGILIVADGFYTNNIIQGITHTNMDASDSNLLTVTTGNLKLKFHTAVWWNRRKHKLNEWRFVTPGGNLMGLNIVYASQCGLMEM